MFKELSLLVERAIVLPRISYVSSLLNSEIRYLFVDGIFVLDIKNNLKLVTNRVFKRMFDLLLSVILLIPFAFVTLIVSVLIKLDSKGKVFYVSKRLGQNGEVFSLLKFRTMYECGDKILEEYLSKNKEACLQWEKYKKLKDFDPRITKVGRFLRKTSLDELPQIVNVLLGQMSFVGPRPYLESELEKVGSSIKKTILLAKPGITGLWQVSGRNELDFNTRLELDKFYVTNWSLWLDIIILLKTVRAVIEQKGAY